MEKKGYVRTLEAIIAILIIFIFIYTILPRQDATRIVRETPVEVRLLHQAILNEIENNSTLRDDVLASNNAAIDEYVADILSLVGSYDHNLNIQDASGPIVQPASLPEDKNVYADSVVIGSSLSSYSPKLVTLYIWE